MDGLVSKNGCGTGVVLKSPDGTKIEHAIHFNFKGSNNEAKYKTLLARVRIARSLNLLEVEIFSDSQLVYNQVMGGFEVKEEKLKSYRAIAKEELENFQKFELVLVKKEQNKEVDTLTCLGASLNMNEEKWIKIEKLEEPSNTEKASVMSIVEEEDCREHIKLLLKNQFKFDNPMELRKVKTHCCMISEDLCEKRERKEIVESIHKRGNKAHQGWKTLHLQISC